MYGERGAEVLKKKYAKLIVLTSEGCAAFAFDQRRLSRKQPPLTIARFERKYKGGEYEKKIQIGAKNESALSYLYSCHTFSFFNRQELVEILALAYHLRRVCKARIYKILLQFLRLLSRLYSISLYP